MKSLNTYFVLLFLIFCSCTKDKTPLSLESTEPTKWERLAGSYDVFDTLGNYLYEMNISHYKSAFANLDSLYFTNLDGCFSFGAQQPVYSGEYINKFQFGHHQLLLDNFNSRWKFVEVGNLPYNNFKNDTIKIKFRITNINYWMLDAVAYCDTTKIQVAVKQH